MRFVKVESSCVDSVGYEGKILYAKFNSGKVYAYIDVPVEKFVEMINSPSIGQFINKELKNNYDASEVASI